MMMAEYTEKYHRQNNAFFDHNLLNMSCQTMSRRDRIKNFNKKFM